MAREDRDLSEELIAKWNDAAAKLENAGLRINAMDNYIHAIWCSREGYTSKKSLDGIASKLATADRLKEFVQELEGYCGSYLDIVDPKENSALAEDLRDLYRLNVVQSRSFLMMVHKESQGRFKEAVDLVLSLQIRNVTIGPDQANA